ncbi:site-specific integrase [Jeotgalibaca dankookensis]|uniref:site-specific integrase n=1 Tax=Jeotgalibaca dankookensis TaxID=708126 RepID=UPI000781AF4A|nr:site-specific integrase [Jeotgalibaca dankookensis]
MASYRKIKTGWQYIISYKDDTGKKRQKTGSGYRTKSEAKQVAEPLEIEIKKNGNITNNDVLFTDYYHRWMHTYKYDLFSEETNRIYLTTEKLITEYFPGMKLKDISMDYYQTFLNTLSKKLAKETVRKYHNKVGACLRHAFHTGVIPVDVTYKATVTGKPGKNARDKFISEAELKNVVLALKTNIKESWTSRYMLLLQTATGMRLGEVMAITFDDIDFKKETIQINKSWDYKYSKNFKNTKNGIHRTIDLDKETIQWLRKYVVFQKKRMLACPIKNHPNLIFTDDKMQPISEKAVNDALKSACRRANVKELTSHALRHTHASLLLLHGVDIQIVAERLGDSVEVVSKVYAHVLDEMRDRNKEKIKSIAASIF